VENTCSLHNISHCWNVRTAQLVLLVVPTRAHPFKDFSISSLLTVVLTEQMVIMALASLVSSWIDWVSYALALECHNNYNLSFLNKITTSCLNSKFFYSPWCLLYSFRDSFTVTMWVHQRLNEAWDKSQLNPTCTRKISLSSTPRPQVDNNDILLVVGFNPLTRTIH